MLFGKGDRISRQKAIKLIKQSSKAGYAEALHSLGAMHKYGDLVERNISLSDDLYKESCEKQYSMGCNSLGISYLEQNMYKEAEGAFEKSAQLGSTLALYNLGYLSEQGFGVPVDKKRAEDYYSRAARLGSNIAQYRMFWYSYKGFAKKKDYAMAYTWLMVSELDKRSMEDDLPGWNDDIPANTRFFVEKLLNTQQRQKAKTDAKLLVEKISIDAEKHRRKHLYQRASI